MRKNNFGVSLILAFFMSFAFSLSAFANSSWVWITESRPYDILPIVIVFTLVTETFMIKYFTSIDSASSVFVPVLAGNILSYTVPYITYSQTTPYAGYYSLAEILDRGPFYTVGIAFLITTLVVEIPVVYLFLKKKANSRKSLIAVAIAANVFTTLVVALTERIICRGQW